MGVATVVREGHCLRAYKIPCGSAQCPGREVCGRGCKWITRPAHGRAVFHVVGCERVHEKEEKGGEGREILWWADPGLGGRRLLLDGDRVEFGDAELGREVALRERITVPSGVCVRQVKGIVSRGRITWGYSR